MFRWIIFTHELSTLSPKTPPWRQNEDLSRSARWQTDQRRPKTPYHAKCDKRSEAIKKLQGKANKLSCRPQSRLVKVEAVGRKNYLLALRTLIMLLIHCRRQAKDERIQKPLEETRLSSFSWFMLTVLFPLLLQTSSIFSRPVISPSCSRLHLLFQTVGGFAVSAIPTTNLDGGCVESVSELLWTFRFSCSMCSGALCTWLNACFRCGYGERCVWNLVVQYHLSR